MKGKNYQHSACKRGVSLEVIKTPEMLQHVLMIDQSVIQGILKEQESLPGSRIAWRGKCPFCSSHKAQRRQSHQSYKPAHIIPGSVEGYVFHCCACQKSLPVYKFLRESHGLDSAETYAEERWNAGELCGAGWNCPLPQKVKEMLEQQKQSRRKQYQEEYERKKRENYLRKYG